MAVTSNTGTIIPLVGSELTVATITGGPYDNVSAFVIGGASSDVRSQMTYRLYAVVGALTVLIAESTVLGSTSSATLQWQAVGAGAAASQFVDAGGTSYVLTVVALPTTAQPRAAITGTLAGVSTADTTTSTASTTLVVPAYGEVSTTTIAGFARFMDVALNQTGLPQSTTIAIYASNGAGSVETVVKQTTLSGPDGITAALRKVELPVASAYRVSVRNNTATALNVPIGYATYSDATPLLPPGSITTYPVAVTSAAGTKGQALVPAGAAVALANAAEIASTQQIIGVAAANFVPGGTVPVITNAPLSTTLANLGPGTQCAVGVNTDGTLVRVTDVTCTSKLVYAGLCDTTGAVFVNPRTEYQANVVDFGAVGDATGATGVGTDDTAAIQAALNTGEFVFIPLGKYRTTAKLSVPSDIHVQGTGTTSVIVGDHADHILETAGIINGSTPVNVALDSFECLSTIRQIGFVTNATNASPIAVTLGAPHGLATGAFVNVTAVTGNTAANGPHQVTVTGPSAFTLNGSTGNGAYTGGGGVDQRALSGVHDIATTFNTHNKLTCGGCFFGRIIEQAELWTSYDYNGTSNLIGQDYFTNGDDITPGANAGFVNVVSSYNSNWDGGQYGLIDDGGIAHTFLGSNANAQLVAGMRLAGIVGGSIQSSDQETTTTLMETTSFLKANGTGNCTQFDFVDVSWSVSSPFCVTIHSAGAIRFVNCSFASASTLIAGTQNAFKVDVVNASFAFGATLFGAGNPTSGSILAAGGPDTAFITSGTAAPVAGTWTYGSMVWNTTPVSGGFIGFVCVVGGTPGTWKGFGLIA